MLTSDIVFRLQKIVLMWISFSDIKEFVINHKTQHKLGVLKSTPVI